MWELQTNSRDLTAIQLICVRLICKLVLHAVHQSPDLKLSYLTHKHKAEIEGITAGQLGFLSLHQYPFRCFPVFLFSFSG